MENMNAPAVEMPRYKSHKHVWALKIRQVQPDPASDSGAGLITPENTVYAPFKVDAAYMVKHNPQPGGYYVLYADGYKSFSPAKAFEDGYSPV